jgi:hypothetical protein
MMATYLQKAGKYCFQKMTEPKENNYDSTVYIKIEIQKELSMEKTI